MSGTSILIVDDEAILAGNLAKVLRRRGFDVGTAENGLLGLSLLAQKHFDVILLDLKMPGMSGAQMIPEIKRLSPRTQIILLTGQTVSNDEEKWLAAGVFACLFKPCQMAELFEAIRAAVEHMHRD